MQDSEAYGFRRFDIDDKLKLGRLLDGDVPGLCAFEDLVDEGSCAYPDLDDICGIRHETARVDVRLYVVHDREPISFGQLDDATHVREEHGVRTREDPACACRCRRCEE